MIIPNGQKNLPARHRHWVGSGHDGRIWGPLGNRINLATVARDRLTSPPRRGCPLGSRIIYRATSTADSRLGGESPRSIGASNLKRQDESRVSGSVWGSLARSTSWFPHGARRENRNLNGSKLRPFNFELLGHVVSPLTGPPPSIGFSSDWAHHGDAGDPTRAG